MPRRTRSKSPSRTQKSEIIMKVKPYFNYYGFIDPNSPFSKTYADHRDATNAGAIASTLFPASGNSKLKKELNSVLPEGMEVLMLYAPRNAAFVSITFKIPKGKKRELEDFIYNETDIIEAARVGDIVVALGFA